MRSLVIFEIEHGETTDPLVGLIHMARLSPDLEVVDYTLKVDLPSCFVLGEM